MSQYSENFERPENIDKLSTLSSNRYAPKPREHLEKFTGNCIHETLRLPISEKMFDILKYVVSWGMLCLALLEILRKSFGLVSVILAPTVRSILHALKSYFCQIDNILEWFTFISVFFISNLFWQSKRQWQEHLVPFAVLFGWTNLMMMVGQLPLFRSYVSMYTCVLREFVKLLLAYLCLLIGFAISFCVIFKQAKEFSDPLIALVKVFVMMTEELEFNELLVEKIRVNTTESGDEKFLPITTPIIFVACLLLLTVALMNLLVAIAVHDIKGLRVSASLSKLENQAILVNYVETALSILSHGCCSSVFSTKLASNVITKKFRATSTLLRLETLNQEDTMLPREIVQEAYELANRCNNVDKKVTRDTNDNSRHIRFCMNARPKKNKSVSLPRNSRMRRTVYVKVNENNQDQTKELDYETLASLKQISEENQTALSEMRGMLTLILANISLPSTPPDHVRSNEHRRYQLIN